MFNNLEQPAIRQGTSAAIGAGNGAVAGAGDGSDIECSCSFLIGVVLLQRDNFVKYSWHWYVTDM